MDHKIYLNDLLKLSEEELSKTKIKFNQSDGVDDPMELYKKNPDEINIDWLFWRTKQRYFNVGQIAVCLMRLSQDEWLLTTIKEVTKELQVINGVNYEGIEIDRLKPYFGRVIIKYHKKHQTQGVFAKEFIGKLEVLQILPIQFTDDEFPGYDNVRLSYTQLKTIINRKISSWIAALENQKAVYLITDLSNGKLYVGSAYSENGMLLQRWKNYIDTGHGGNKELVTLVDTMGIDYVKENFQYSILENYNARVGDYIIQQRETWWKKTLDSRRHGYNAN